jgi:hypothetical protein
MINGIKFMQEQSELRAIATKSRKDLKAGNH